jgi:glycerol-3-phosphate dehydrogenase
VPPLGTLPSAFAAERCSARAVAVLGGPAHAAEMLERGASLVLASADAGLARQIADALHGAGLDVTVSADVTGVELAGVAASAAVLAAAAATPEGPAIAGAAAGKVFAEVDELARARGGRPETFAGLAGTGELVATVATGAAVNGRARELLAHGARRGELGVALGPAAEAVDSVPLLAQAAHKARLQTPALDRLAALVQGEIAPEGWAATVTEPTHPKPRAA